MKEKVMSAMQAFSKAMFMPVLILPIAGLLIAVGNVLTNDGNKGSWNNPFRCTGSDTE